MSFEAIRHHYPSVAKFIVPDWGIKSTYAEEISQSRTMNLATGLVTTYWGCLFLYTAPANSSVEKNCIFRSEFRIFVTLAKQKYINNILASQTLLSLGLQTYRYRKNWVFSNQKNTMWIEQRM